MSDLTREQNFSRPSFSHRYDKEKQMTSGNRKEEYNTELKTGEQLYAVKNYSDQRNKNALKISEGDVITLLDQYSDGMCRGYISRLGIDSKVGLFPTTCVVPFTRNNINSGNSNVLRKCSRKMSQSKEKEQSSNSPVTIRNRVKGSSIDTPTKPSGEIAHMYSCNYIEIRNSQIDETKLGLPLEALNRGSTCSVDSGRGSTTVTMMNSIKMNMPIQSISTFDQTQYIPENNASQSIESGLASYQHQSSSSSSSIDGGSNMDISKHNSCVMDNQCRQLLNTTFEEEEKDEAIIKNWLQKMNLDIYTSNFVNSGYDFNTLLRMTPEDLNAIGVTNPKHRKIIKNDISNIVSAIKENVSESLPDSVEEWLILLNLTPYLKIILQQGYDEVEKLTDLTWEDLEEIGIKKLGHQKKIILAVEKLKKIGKTSITDKLSMSYSAENFRDPKSKFIISETSPMNMGRHERHSANSAYLDLSKPTAPNRQVSRFLEMSLSSNINSSYSPNHAGRPTSFDPKVFPLTPKRSLSMLPTTKQSIPSAQNFIPIKLYENIDEFQQYSAREINILDKEHTFIRSDKESKYYIKPEKRLRGSSFMLVENNGIPFANENCGTIKQRSSSLDRTDVIREEIEFSAFIPKSSIPTSAKPLLPLNLPYNIDLLSYKPLKTSRRIQVNINSERTVQTIPSDVHVAVCEKVQLPKLHMEDNSSNEDFNDICDMLEDLTELLDKDISRNT